MRKIMAVCDGDSQYAFRLAEFMNQRKMTPFSVQAFTSRESLETFLNGHEVELLLISQKLLDEEELLKAGQVMLLNEGESLPKDKGGLKSVYKYQSCEDLVREVVAGYCVEQGDEAFPVFGSRCKVRAVYSPVNRCGKTTFALTLGQILAKESKTLFVSLEECSGLSSLIPGGGMGGLSDLLYFYRQQDYSWARLSSVTYSWGELDVVPPVRYPEDLNQLSADEWTVLLSQMGRESAYENLIVDIGSMGKQAVKLMEVCDAIYMPVKEDFISKAKLDEFETYLGASGRDGLKERIHRLKLPGQKRMTKKENYLEQLVWGDLGDYIRYLLSGKEEEWSR